MSKIAIDVVLLPEEKIMKMAIAHNKRLRGKYEPKLRLGRSKCIPHLSILQGVIKKEDQKWVGALLGEISNDFNGCGWYSLDEMLNMKDWEGGPIFKRFVLKIKKNLIKD